MNLIIIFIQTINIINYCFSKVVNINKIENNKQIQHQKFVATKISNPYKINLTNNGKKIIFNTDSTYYNLPYGYRCNEGKNMCSLEFKELGPFSYNGFTECYIYNPVSGPDDKLKKNTPQFVRVYIDINATLKCIVNGVTYSNVQRVNIYGYDNKLPNINHFKPGLQLSHGSNSINNERDTYYITLNECTFVWTYRTSSDLDCHVDKIKMVNDGPCGKVNNNEYLICQNQCCGQDGKCSNQPNSCGIGCQSNFGICN